MRRKSLGRSTTEEDSVNGSFNKRSLDIGQAQNECMAEICEGECMGPSLEDEPLTLA